MGTEALASALRLELRPATEPPPSPPSESTQCGAGRSRVIWPPATRTHQIIPPVPLRENARSHESSVPRPPAGCDVQKISATET
jgi:hypothetical protein